MTDSINLNEISLPLKLNEEIPDFNEIFQQGSISSAVKVKAEIKKISLKEFNFIGLIRGKFESQCQYCLDQIKVPIKIESNVIIQDLSNLEDSDNDLDVHFQDLDFFKIEELILEEIYLNSSTSLVCSEDKCRTVRESFTDTDKVRPFKKIRDLIK
tara:strand:+ start:3018 stop:3485 length:468 start_codon:yes stop_codon:yes gene_type:complete